MSYLAHTHRPTLIDAIKSIEDATRDRLDTFQYVLVTGLSGIVPGAIFCHMYNKDLVVARKPGENCHGKVVEGPYDWDTAPDSLTPNRNYIIIDDFISGGHTLQRLLDIHSNKKMPEFVVLYSSRQSLTMSPPQFEVLYDGVPNRFTLHPRKR